MPAKVVSTPALPGLSPVGGKPVIARFDGGHLSSDGGLLVLREVEQRLDETGLAALERATDDSRLSEGELGTDALEHGSSNRPLQRET